MANGLEKVVTYTQQTPLSGLLSLLRNVKVIYNGNVIEQGPKMEPAVRKRNHNVVILKQCQN